MTSGAATATGEKEMLLETLDDQRKHVVGILEGLSEGDLRRPVLPSGWTCLGLVQHLAIDVERFWFSEVVSGGAGGGDAPVHDAWHVAPDVPSDDVFDRYRREVTRATAVIQETPLDAEPRWWPEGLFGTWRLKNLRHIVLHVVAETACHAGHLDAARELVDGRTWLVLG